MEDMGVKSIFDGHKSKGLLSCATNSLAFGGLLIKPMRLDQWDEFWVCLKEAMADE